MEKPTIRIYQEPQSAHYIGEDCSIILKYKTRIEKWEIDLIEDAIINILEGSNHEILSRQNVLFDFKKTIKNIKKK